MSFRVGRHTVYDDELGKIRRYTEEEENTLGDMQYDSWREEQDDEDKE